MRVLVVIPAYNEARNLPAVVAEIRDDAPHADILVVDDGSEDDTDEVLRSLDVQAVRLPVRLGVGTAVRTGLKYAKSHGYHAVVRLDGDGQHPAARIAALLEPLREGSADLVSGSRYAAAPRPASVPWIRRLAHYALGRVLSRLTRRLVTDPTSGLWAFGPRAIDLLAEHHPPGYAEPELILLSSQAAMRCTEVPVEMRKRLGGETSLTLARASAAMVRLAFLLALAPLRSVRSRSRSRRPV